MSDTDVSTAVKQRAVGGQDVLDIVAVGKAKNPRLTADAGDAVHDGRSVIQGHGESSSSQRVEVEQLLL